MVGRRSLVGFGVAAGLVGPWARAQAGAAGQAGAGVTESEIVLGTSAAFSGPSRGLGIELYRGAMAYFEHINGQGGVRGRQVVLKLYDDGYQPDPCVNNTQLLMREDRVFLLFAMSARPRSRACCRCSRSSKDQGMYLFFPFTGAQPQREPPLWRLCVQLARLVPPRDGRLGRQLRGRGPAPHSRLLSSGCLWPQRLGRRAGRVAQAWAEHGRRGDLPAWREVYRAPCGNKSTS